MRSPEVDIETGHVVVAHGIASGSPTDRAASVLFLRLLASRIGNCGGLDLLVKFEEVFQFRLAARATLVPEHRAEGDPTRPNHERTVCSDEAA